MKNTMYSALYLRSATIELSSVKRLAENRQNLEKRAFQEDVTIFKVYEDQGVSGLSKSQSRPGMAALLDDISQGHIQVLYIAGIDRVESQLR